MLVLGFVTHTFRRSSSEKLIKGLQIPMLVVRGEKAMAVTERRGDDSQGPLSDGFFRTIPESIENSDGIVRTLFRTA